MHAQPLSRFVNTGAESAALLLALAIPVSVALDNILMAFLLILGLLGYIPATWRKLRSHPVARASILLFLALGAGCLYGDTPIKDASGMLGKYADLAFVPLLLVIFQNARLRDRAWLVFLATMALTALLSWLVYLQLMPMFSWMWKSITVDNPAIFRGQITQNILMGFASYVLIVRAVKAADIRARLGYVLLAALTVSSVLFLVQGRIGYLILLSTLLWLGFHAMKQRFNSGKKSFAWIHGIATLTLLPLSLWLVYQVVPRLHQRVDLTISEYQAWYPHSGQLTSIGERLEFYYNTAGIILANPLLGTGTGGFAAAYAQQAKLSSVTATTNPHNEYLHLTVQLGILGGLLFLYLLYTQWRSASAMQGKNEFELAAGLTLTLAVTSLVNTPLMDHSEGLFFAYMSALCFAPLMQGKQHV